jgi:hypothetical protein
VSVIGGNLRRNYNGGIATRGKVALVAVRIKPVPDERAEKILENPSDYYAEARQRAREEVEREVARERAGQR